MKENTMVKFYESAADELLRFAVIIAKTQESYIFCRHKDRDTWEIPGGHRESGETIIDTARRELYEETGALEFDIEPICTYFVNFNGQESFGMLCFADIRSFEADLHSEIQEIIVTKELPQHWTYPDIHPRLMEEAQKRGFL